MRATSIKMNERNMSQDFWLVFAATGSKNVIKDAMSALYYLPDNFKLLILEDKAQAESRPNLAKEISSRIIYKTREGIQNLSALPISAGAFIYDSLLDPIVELKPSVNVSTQTPGEISHSDSIHYTINANNPEALATAALHISRMSI